MAETIQIRVPARALGPTGDTDVTAVGVPYFQWDDWDGGPMRM